MKKTGKNQNGSRGAGGGVTGNLAASRMPSQIPYIAWPPLRLGPQRGIDLPIATLLETERWPSDHLEAAQYRQLRELVDFASRHSPFIKARMETAGLMAADLTGPDALQRLPIMTRRDVQDHAATLDCRAAARLHGPFAEKKTSGSSGEPVSVQTSRIAQVFWMAYSLRDHLWHQRDFSGSMAIIKGTAARGDHPNWGVPAALYTTTGPAYTLPVNTPISEQVVWLMERQPQIIMTYPNMIAAFLDAAEAGHLQLTSLREVRTLGETMPDPLRQRVCEVWGVSVSDIYSAEDVGMIACQCKESGRYHIMEGVIVELLDNAGQPVGPATPGRVVVTPLHNFAMPLLRYDIGDYAIAESTGPCPCGRNLPTLERIYGRARNLMQLADGRRFWPLIGFAAYRDEANVRQYQIIQRSFDDLEVRLVADPRPDAAQEERLRAIIRKATGHDFAIHFVYIDDALPRGPNGKFEEFICAL